MAVVALDVGGTTLKGGVLDASGPSSRVRADSCRADGPQAAVAAVLATLDRLLAAAAGAGQEVEAIGLAVLGIVDEDAGIARESASIGWRDVPFRQLVVERSGRRVTVGHDVRAAALAEATLGAGRDHSDVLFLAIGTGISLAQVVDGRVVRGSGWRAGEIGQLPVVSSGTEERDDTNIEGVASGWGLARRYEQRTGRPAGTASAAEVIAAAAGGEAMAGAVLDQALEPLAQALAVTITVADPGVVVVGGGVAQAGDALLGPLMTKVSEALAWREPPPLLPARFGDEAGWVGAGLLAWRLAGHTDCFSDEAWP